MKILVSIMAAIFFIGTNTTATFGRDFVRIETSTTAVVVEVLDINAIVVRLPNGNEALVQLIGVAPGGSPEGIRYLTTEIMGSSVMLTRDSALVGLGRWNLMYVTHTGRSINGILLQSGHAFLEDSHRNASQFSTLSQNQVAARANALGVWSDGTFADRIISFGAQININTASQAQFVEMLNISQTLANAIVSHRNSIVFQHINDIKFVNGMTQEIFNAHRHRFTVSTDVNTATAEELATLISINTARAQDIVNYRNRSRVVNLEHMVRDNIITRAMLNSNAPFMSIENTEIIAYARPDFMANINTANRAQLERAGATTAQAGHILEQRGFMSLKTLNDLRDLSGFNANQINALSDNLRVATNINTAARSEIESLFGGNVVASQVTAIINNRPYTNINQIIGHIPETTFNSIAPFIYIGEHTTDFININTASRMQLTAAGFSETQANAITNSRTTSRRPSDISRFALGNMSNTASIVTNVNRASIAELRSLDANLTADTANRIITYRNDQPFGSMAEFERFMISLDQRSLFSRIRDFIVFR